MPMVEVVKPFNKHHAGDIAEPGEVIEVTDTRRDELKRLGLARDPQPEAKQAPTPENKMAPEAATKRRGRPPKVR